MFETRRNTLDPFGPVSLQKYTFLKLENNAITLWNE